MKNIMKAQGYSGTVEEIHITNTKLRTGDKVVYIPNGTLSAGSIVNYSEKDTRRRSLSDTLTTTKRLRASLWISAPLTSLC